jgi:signal transduction histidine kinase
VRVKIWSADGTVVYSDEQRLIGTRFALEHQELEAFRGHAVEAEISDLGRPENRLERPEGKLLEVYLPIRGRDGQPLLFEAYQRYSSVSAGGHRLWLAFAPALLGGLLLLQLVNVPLARSMARRLRDGQQERAELLQRALHAQQTERRLIAANLHDGVVQDLAATSFALAAQSERLNGHGDREAADALRHGAAHTRDSVRALRTLLVDIYPPSLRQSGLAAALGDLAKTCTARGMQTTVDIREDDDLDEQTEQLLFRCAQETLRNTQKHAGATAAIVAVRDDAHRIVMEVSDDGSGVDPDVIAARREGGHFGLRMLEDLVTDAGGRLDVVSAPGAGTTVRVEVPR